MKNISSLKDHFIFYLVFIFPVTNFLVFRREIFLTIFVIMIFKYFKQIKFSFVFLVLISLYFVIITLQTIFYGRFSLVSLIGEIIFLTYPFLAVIYFRQKFSKLFINLMVIITVISFCFYIPSLLFRDFHQFIGQLALFLNLDSVHVGKQYYQFNFIVFTWEPYFRDVLRNSANFNEPGYFACYLGLALSMNILKEKNILTKRNLLFIFGLISTLSTAGFIALGLVLLLAGMKYFSLVSKVIIIPIAIILMYNAFITFEFLSKKITTHYEQQQVGYNTWGRFGATLANLNDIKESPLIGRGLLKQTRYSEIENWDFDTKPYQNLNSWTDTWVRLGTVVFFVFMYFYAISIRNFVRTDFDSNNWVLILGAVLILLSSQPILFTPIFTSLLFLGYPETVKKR